MYRLETEHNFNKREEERKKQIKKTAVIMRGIKSALVEQGLTTQKAQIHQGWDVHCFFPLAKEPNRIVHIQLYMGAPIQQTVDVKIREMDKEKIRKERKLSSIGAEENAVTKVIMQRNKVIYNKEAISILVETGIRACL